MLKSFSFLYRSFFDRHLSDEFIQKSNGIGLPVLFHLSFLCSFMYAIIFFIFSFDRENALHLISQIPDIQIENATIVSPTDYFKEIPILNGKAVFVIDTMNNRPVFTKGGVYISKNAIFSVAKGQEHRFPLTDIFVKKDILINQDVMEKGVDLFLSRWRFVMIVFTLVALLPLFFFGYIWASFIFTFFSYIITFFIPRNLDFYQRFRLAVLSLLPVFILKAVALFLGVYMSVVLSYLIGIVYMAIHLKEMSSNYKKS